MKFSMPITPVSLPRMTQRDVWLDPPRKCVAKWRRYRDELRHWLPEELPSELGIEFTMPMANSWSKKRKEKFSGQPHQQTPDIDNLIKAVLDAIGQDDAHVHRIEATKIWGYEGQLTVWEL